MARGGFRWLQICVGVICMVMIANLQYGWTFFVPDIQKTFHWDRSEIQIAFTLFVLFETWLVPIEGWFVDQWGPKIVILAGGILAGLGWIMNAYATTLGRLTAAGFGMDSAFTALLAIGVLKPWRFRVVRQGEQSQAGMQIGAAARA